ncbi:hypothetical protein [Streptomyces sp. NPDC005423]|uniref:hypothetical protein n=1 Tax=Streptomyces sp. NPDC005423 TaxID=3155343 RepID=UPI0033A330CF
MVSALAGFRRAVSLALALGVPCTLDFGGPFPDRDTIVFVTAGVVVTTLVVQALVLPSVARWAQLPNCPTAQLPYDTDADRELVLAWTTAARMFTMPRRTEHPGPLPLLRQVSGRGAEPCHQPA